MRNVCFLKTESDIKKALRNQDASIYFREGDEGDYELASGYSYEEISDATVFGFEFVLVSGPEVPKISESEVKVASILSELSSSEKDSLYRALWSDHVREDVIARLEDTGAQLSSDEIDEIVKRYVYEGDYDCNLTYWDNIDNLANEYTKGKEDR